MPKRAALAATSGIVVASVLVTATPAELSTAAEPAEVGMPVEQARWTLLNRSCMAPATTAPVLDGTPLRVNVPPHVSFVVGSLDTNLWRHPPKKADASWRLWFNSMQWAQAYGQTAHNLGQTESLSKIVEQVTRFYVKNPDRGTNANGWDEGTSLRRLETLNCLYSLSKDDRLPALMAKEVTVQGSHRYYGPPNKNVVHNHGTMANIAIVTAGLHTGNRKWQRFGAGRLASEASGAFSAKGVNLEQSAEYHLVNRNVWTMASIALDAVLPGSKAAKNVRQRVTEAGRVANWLTEPDGKFVQIGDSTRLRGEPGTGRAAGGAFRDDEAGYLLGRWSWTDPNTTYYTVRYGPPIRSHGHLDKSSVTWSTAGSRVLIGPGYGRHDPFMKLGVPWWRTAPAHNTSSRGSCTATDADTARITSQRHRGTAAIAVLEGQNCGVRHTRGVTVDHRKRSFSVTDQYASRGTFRQYWHLDPSWVAAKPKNASTLTFTNSKTGRTLTVTTNGKIRGVVHGSPRRAGGWNYVDTDTRQSAPDITVQSTGRLLRTSFVVR